MVRTTHIAYKVLLIAILLLSASSLYAQTVKLVIDPKTIEAVTQNTATQSAIENMHNTRVDTILSKQKRIMEYTSTMALIKEVYQYTMQNVHGFGSESKYYVNIGLTAYDIVALVPKVVKNIKHSNMAGKTLCISETYNLLAKTQQLVQDFVNIVTNTTVKNPLSTATTKESKDSYNLMNRYDRLNMAISIYTDLISIKYRMLNLENLSKYATWDNVFREYDPEGWAIVRSGLVLSNSLIYSWKGMTK